MPRGARWLPADTSRSHGQTHTFTGSPTQATSIVVHANVIKSFGSRPFFPQAGTFPASGLFPRSFGAGIIQAQATVEHATAKHKTTFAQAQQATARKGYAVPKAVTQPTASAASSAINVAAGSISITQPTSTTATAPPSHNSVIPYSQSTSTRRIASVHRRLDVLATPPRHPSLGQHASIGRHATGGRAQRTAVVISGAGHSATVIVSQTSAIGQIRHVSSLRSVTQTEAITKIVLPLNPTSVTQASSTTAQANAAVSRSASQSQASSVSRRFVGFRIIGDPQPTHLNISSATVHGSTVGIRQPQDTAVSFFSNTLKLQLSLLQPTKASKKLRASRAIGPVQSETVGIGRSHPRTVSATQPSAVTFFVFPFGPIVVLEPIRSQPSSLGLRSSPRELEVV